MIKGLVRPNQVTRFKIDILWSLSSYWTLKKPHTKINTLMGLDNSRLIFIFILAWGFILCYNLPVGEKLSALLRARPCGAALSTYLSAYIGVSTIELNWSSGLIHFRSDYQLRIVFQIGVSGQFPSWSSRRRFKRVSLLAI